MNILIFLSFIGYVLSSGYQCRGPNKITPPDDLNQVVNWPSIWNDSMPPIPFASQQSCIWEIVVPEGLYATVVFHKNSPSTVSIAAFYPGKGTGAGIDNNDLNPYIFTSPQATINLYKSKDEGAFSFKVLWSKYPTVPHDNIQLVKGAMPTAIIPNGHLSTFTAETIVSLVGFGLKNQSEYPLLRQSAVYDGNSTDAEFLGTLYSIMMSKKEVISSGKSLTVFTWGLNNQFDYTLYMVQDHTNELPFFTYRGVNCADGFDCSFQINAVYGTSVLATSDSHSEFIKNIETFPDTGTLKVYEGPISDETLVTKLTKSNYKTRLPMELKNSLRQYVLDTGTITGFIITRDSNSADWNKVYDGRKGFVHSFYHGVYSTQQDTDETMFTQPKQKLYFNYVVRDADFTGAQTSLTVTVMSDGKQIISDTFNSGNPPPITTKNVQGDTYHVKYESRGANTKGFRIDFSTTSSTYEKSTSIPPISSMSTTGKKGSTTIVATTNSVPGTQSFSTSSTFFSTLTTLKNSIATSSKVVETTSQIIKTTPTIIETTTKPVSLVTCYFAFIISVMFFSLKL
ncbi:hypothetical protein L3Y34_004625 [Caenorhabditis briggsae]|uniref:CUB-like domain-containing protein n=1 Tax=Caenorhabditis briggsae TaxID=6238 RepID=A0AAE9D4Y0_CAEBR|nr:hypothetical protein L3Y34_004625 [Caenorhabditis briggsae]